MYDLLVYIAHTQKARPTKLEDEYSANVWAIERCYEYHNWVKTKEDYSIMRVYDDIFDIDINEVLKNTSRKRKTNTQ